MILSHVTFIDRPPAWTLPGDAVASPSCTKRANILSVKPCASIIASVAPSGDPASKRSAGERSFSPTFQGCVQGDHQSDSENTAEKNPSAFVGTVFAYGSCTGEFIEKHDGAITALATIIIAAFTGTLWVATSQQAQLTKEALIADKKAFVFATGFNSYWERDGTTDLYNWRFRPIWQNSGDTPTKDMKIYVQCELRNSQLPPQFDFIESGPPPGPGMLAPKNTAMGGIAPAHPGAAITPHDIEDIKNGRKFLYLWGWARYFDVFPRTDRHITRFCWVILPSGDPFTFAPGQTPIVDALKFHNIHHTEGNCADDECAAQ